MIRTEPKATALLLFLALTCSSEISWSQAEAPTDFARLDYESACDATNKRLVLVNAHTYKSLQVTVRWRADGGNELQDQFFPGPNSRTEIGCAADAQILEVTFASF